MMDFYLDVFSTLLTFFYMLEITEGSTTITSHTDYNCTVSEIQRSACLNGGVCFVTILDHRHPSCHCPIEYTGSRCHELNIEVLFGAAEISIIVVVCIVVLVFVGIAIYIYFRRKRKLPILPCTKQEPSSISKNEDEVTAADKMLNGEDRNRVEIDSSH